VILHGRQAEQAAIAELLESARQGVGASMALVGEAGSGKSSLLRDAVGHAGQDMTTVATSGVESEAPLAFAALQRLLRPLWTHMAAVPAPQAHALRVALGEEGGEVGDRFLVFMGALSLLAAEAEQRPVLAIVDDAQWLDDASAAALHFVARRITMEPIALLWAAREEGKQRFDLGEIPVLQLTGLGLEGVSAILEEQAQAVVAPEVSALLLATTGGNPLAVRELTHVLTGEQLAGGAPLPPRLPVTERVQRVFLDRARRLSQDAQTVLLVASADDSARLATVLRAAQCLGADPTSLMEVERSGLVTLTDDGITLRHPLVRSAMYGAAPSAERRRVHAALAEVLTREEDADRRAWHRSASVVEPDAGVVAELAEAAVRAEKRGGHEAASAAWARAAELTEDSAERARYLFAASRTAWVSGHPARAKDLAERAIGEATDPQLLADARRLRGRIEWNTGSVQLANRMLLAAAVGAADHDPARAREMAAEAVSVAAWGGESGSGMDATTIVDPPSGSAPARERTYDRMLRGLARVVARDYAGAAPPLREAFGIYEELPEDYELLPNLSIGAMHLGEFDRSEAYMTRLLARARNEGVLVMVLYASTRLTMTDLVAGRWSDAVGHATEAVTLGEVTGNHVLAGTPRAFLLLLAALRGEEDTFEGLAPKLHAATSRGSAGVLDVVLRDVEHWAHGVRQASRPASAFHHFAQMSHDVTRRMAGLDRIEAAVHADQSEAARWWVEDFASFAAATGQAWAGAVAEHGRALLADPGSAEDHFRRALALHGRAGDTGAAARPFNRARTQLAYGEYLRRSRRRVDARTHLRACLDTFEAMRAQPFAERAAQELRASGETARKRDEPGGTVLTPQERQVAQLVRRGLSNKDVAAQLFVSPRTVDFHLRNVFSKTGVTSRSELAALALD
jgi:DNA-binding CsgD family transcriptional regulator/tetratricopeptide (TPR) repeat protein